MRLNCWLSKAAFSFESVRQIIMPSPDIAICQHMCIWFLLMIFYLIFFTNLNLYSNLAFYFIYAINAFKNVKTEIREIKWNLIFRFVNTLFILSSHWMPLPSSVTGDALLTHKKYESASGCELWVYLKIQKSKVFRNSNWNISTTKPSIVYMGTK